MSWLERLPTRFGDVASNPPVDPDHLAEVERAFGHALSPEPVDWLRESDGLRGD